MFLVGVKIFSWWGVELIVVEEIGRVVELFVNVVVGDIGVVGGMGENEGDSLNVVNLGELDEDGDEEIDLVFLLEVVVFVWFNDFD